MYNDRFSSFFQSDTHLYYEGTFSFSKSYPEVTTKKSMKFQGFLM